MCDRRRETAANSGGNRGEYNNEVTFVRSDSMKGSGGRKMSEGCRVVRWARVYANGEDTGPIPSIEL